MATPLYDRLAGRIATQIRRGVLRAGERMPSLRQLARDQQVSMATAVEAYLQLERQGLVEARPRSGYYVRAAAPAPPREPAARLARTPQVLRNPGLLCVLDSLSRDLAVPLHAATPAPALLPGTALRSAMQQVLRRDPDASVRYAAAEGVRDLRERIAERYVRAGVDVDPDEVVVTAGAMEAISLALRVATQPGDVVLVETPTYHGVLQAVAALGLRVLEVPTHSGTGIDVDCLRRQLARQPVRAVVLVPNVHNPVGSITGDAAKRDIVAACAAHDVTVIEDDLYADLAFSGDRPMPLRHADTRGEVITCGSFSKTLAPGLRVGWALGGRWTAELLRAKSFSTVATATLPQLAIADYLGRHDLDRHLRRLRRTLATNAQRSRDAIARHWPQGTCVSDPGGGLSLWIRLPADVDGQALHEAALRRRIGTLPGHLFSARGAHAHHLRLSFGLPWSPAIEQALRTLGTLASDLARGREG
jgi:DNA-binding transcriptional MocR family regulator